MKNFYFILCCLIFALEGTDAQIEGESSFLIVKEESSDVLVITFGGLFHNCGVPIFEFKNLLSEYPVNMLLIRDIQQKFYQCGISEEGNITKSLYLLEEEINNMNINKIIIFGNSSGGYAALLFGYLLLRDGFPVKVSVK